MSVNGLPFLLFLLAAVVLYYIVPCRFRWIVLLAGSVLFYLSFQPQAALYLGATVIMTYLFALKLGKLAAQKPAGETPEERKADKKRLTRKKRCLLALALILNFSALFIFKYSGFAVQNLNHLFGKQLLSVPSLLLPLGISFYIFQTSGYLIDVQKGKYPPERDPAKYALFVCYFHQMIQGPINRYDALRDQLFPGNRLDWENIRQGILRMMFGVLKKALIADALAPAVQEIYGNYSAYPGGVSFLGAALYCVQLYCDFSGGVDLLCGASRLFGVRMAENFERPYFSSSLAEFWRRWHISLGEWMKDYLFYPLALSKTFGKLTKKARKFLPDQLAKRLTPCIATFVVFLAVGVWQGPGWFNVAYGLWNGFWMSLGLLWAPTGARLRERFPGKGFHLFLSVWGILRTNLLVIIGRYLSNASSLRSAWGMLAHTVTVPGFGSMSFSLFRTLGLNGATVIKVLLALAVLFCISLAQERGIDVAKRFSAWAWPVQFAILFFCLLIIVLGIYGNAGYTPIAYVYENV